MNEKQRCQHFLLHDLSCDRIGTTGYINKNMEIGQTKNYLQ